MRSILSFFLVVFVSLGIGVYFYETEVSSSSADALVIAKKKMISKQAIKPKAIINKSSPSMRKIEDTIKRRVRSSRVIDLVSPIQTDEKVSRQKKIEQSISRTKRKSVSLDIQKAIVMQLSTTH